MIKWLINKICKELIRVNKSFFYPIMKIKIETVLMEILVKPILLKMKKRQY